MKIAETLYQIRNQPIYHVVYGVDYIERLVDDNGQPRTTCFDDDIGDTLWGRPYGQLIFIGKNVYRPDVKIPHLGENKYVGYSTDGLENALSILDEVIAKAEHAANVIINDIINVSYYPQTSTLVFEIDTESD